MEDNVKVIMSFFDSFLKGQYVIYLSKDLMTDVGYHLGHETQASKVITAFRAPCSDGGTLERSRSAANTGSLGAQPG